MLRNSTKRFLTQGKHKNFDKEAKGTKQLLYHSPVALSTDMLLKNYLLMKTAKRTTSTCDLLL